jgi:hypothetical protein
MIIFILRIIESTQQVGDILMWVFRFCPSFSLSNSIVFAAGKGSLAIIRPEVSSEDFSLVNMGGDIVFSCGHFIVWTTLILIIEAGGFNCFRGLSCRKF